MTDLSAATTAPKKKRGFFQRVAKLVKDFAEWVEETFSDPLLSAEVRSDLGLDPTNPATPPPPDPARRARIEQFAAKADVDEASFAEVVADIKAEIDAVVAFIDAVRADRVDARLLFSTMFKVFALDVLRVRNPAAYAAVKIAGLALDDEEFLEQIDAAALTKLVRGEGPAADGEAWVQRLTMGAGVTIVLLITLLDSLKATYDAAYGWDPDPEDEGESAAIAARALTVTFDHPQLLGARPALTLIPVPRAHGGPGIMLSANAGFSLPMVVGARTYLMEVNGTGQFGIFLPFSLNPDELRRFASFAPSMKIRAEPTNSDELADAPALQIGSSDGSRLQIGALSYGVEVTAKQAAFRGALRKGKLVIALGEGDSFLRQLPGGNIEVPFEVGLLASTATGVHLEGGTGLRVNLPVSASVFGVFTVQFLELELRTDPALALDLRGGFSLHLGPFTASVDRVGARLALGQLAEGIDTIGDFLTFAPPRGIGLVLDASDVKGGGFLFIDSERGEYAGALELKFLGWSLKAIGLLSTRRPDGTEGWSLLLFVFGQFNAHLAFGIFLTGVGGMIGLHHRSDVDALSAGMRTGALDDVLFPENPIADAPRIINRYRTLFPVAEGNFLIGPVLELSFSNPPIVFVRLGLVFDVRNALGTGPARLSKVVLVGQVLVQLPPRKTGAPAVLKLLIDVVGFYDADTRFLMVRARLRDSFVGVEGVVKLDLAGELLVAVQFGPRAAFVLSAGGFHPRYQTLPERVPRDLDKLRVSYKLGPISLAIEHYFAITPNSVQAGQKSALKADFGVAKIEASFSWDALFYLSPRFYFVVDLEFRAKVKAFGETLSSVRVVATLEGPDEWHFSGKLTFSILWWDKTIPFNERFGEIVQSADVAAVSLAETLQAELTNPDNVTIEAPVGGASPVTLASGPTTLAHPLGRVAIRQRAVPFGLVIDRIGTRPLLGGPQAVSIASVAVNGAAASVETTTEQFARGQFSELSEDEKLSGPAFEPFPSGVIVGAAGYLTDESLASDVVVSFETVRLDPEPGGLVDRWTTMPLPPDTPSHDRAMQASRLGAAARSDRADSANRLGAAAAHASVVVGEPPLALVGAGTLAEAGELTGAAAHSPSLADQVAAANGQRVIERFELALSHQTGVRP